MNVKPPGVNPFHPMFGVQPYVLAGRADVLSDIRDGLLEGSGSPYRANKIIGPRGVGKTVLLEAAADLALESGWIPISVTPSSKMLDDIIDLALERTAHLRVRNSRPITGVSMRGTGVTFSPPVTEREPGFRIQLERILDEVSEHETGLLFTIDEISDRYEALQIFGKQFQHFIRENRNVALVVAGLPLNVQALESLKDTTFLRRAVPHNIANVSIEAAESALLQTFEDHGRQIDPAALTTAAVATEGYPFLIQLIGYYIWRASNQDYVDSAAVAAGIEQAKRRIGDTVHTSAMADISPMAKIFLLKMAMDDAPALAKDIAHRAGWSFDELNKYRTELIAVGLIRAVSDDRLEFAFPYLREYLNEHAAALVWTQ